MAKRAVLQVVFGVLGGVIDALFSRKAAWNLFTATLHTFGMMLAFVFAARYLLHVTVIVVFVGMYPYNIILKFVFAALFSRKGTDKMNRMTLYTCKSLNPYRTAAVFIKAGLPSAAGISRLRGALLLISEEEG